MRLSSFVATVALACAAGAFGLELVSRLAPGGLDVSRTGGPVQLVPAVESLVLPGVNAPYNVLSNNWAGAVYHGHINGTFRHVTGTIVVPGAITPPDGGDNIISYRGSAWVGIDGYSPCGAILQTGIDWAVQGGNVTYIAWLEWYPAPPVLFTRTLVINAGDTLRFTVDAATSTSGTATVNNLTTRKSVSQAINSSVPLCSTDAEWIVEDFEGSEQIPFANFSTVTFSNAVAVLDGGAGGSFGPVYATLLDLIQNGTVQTQTSCNDSAVTINYIG